jgi:uncharacterized RDD family membrane protein YckC
MKCPKCGYLGFETTDRCRNCGYDFSFAAPALASELPLRTPAADAPLEDLVLGGLEIETPPTTDPHDRDSAGFGRPGPRTPPDLYATPPGPAVALEEPAVSPSSHGDTGDGGGEGSVDDSGEDLPLFAPRPAGTPLGVRRATSDVPRARRNTTRPVRVDSPPLPLVIEVPDDPAVEPVPARPARPKGAESAGVGARVAAAVIDAFLLLAIDAGVLWLTLRIAGLQPTAEDLAIIRPVPMSAFFLVMAFLYLVGFTLGGGQTIGKMATGIRVTGDDGRGVDITGAVVRALGSLLAVGTLGILFVPVLFSAERRAMHDRLAGTRVVIG